MTQIQIGYVLVDITICYQHALVAGTNSLSLIELCLMCDIVSNYVYCILYNYGHY